MNMNGNKNNESKMLALVDTDDTPNHLIKNVIYKWNG